MNLQSLINLALAEDIGEGDITSQLLVPEALKASMRLVAKEKLVAAGVDVAAQVFRTVDNAITIEAHVKDGAVVQADAALLTVKGSARALLAAERVALNFLQRSCGVAMLTRAYVDAVAGTGVLILDTRKTMPGMRVLDKHAVACGGGGNHRFGLYDAVLIKDNHLAVSGQRLAISEIVKEARNKLASLAASRQPLPAIIVECDTLDQVGEAVAAQPDRILLDNMSLRMLREAVKLAEGKVKLEASGGVTLENVRAVAQTGVNFISIGALTHSARAADISAELAL